MHGQALGEDEVVYVKTQLGFNPDDKFVVPDGVYEYFSECKSRGAQLEEEWNKLMRSYKDKYPKEAEELQRRISGKLIADWESLIPSKDKLPTEAQPTRKSSGIVLSALAPKDNSLMVGSADLLESTFVSWKGMSEFQNPASGLGDYSGRQIRYGIREHAMVGMGNGMAAYQKGCFLP